MPLAPLVHDVVLDRQLLTQFARANDAQAFATLVRRYGPLVHGVARRVLGNPTDADDVLQATFMILARRAKGWGLHSSLGGWLYRVAYRLAVRASAAQTERRDHEANANVRTSMLQSSAVADVSSEVASRESLQAIERELSRLPARYREAIVLCGLQGLSRGAAAKQLGCTVKAVQGRLERGRQLLLARLPVRDTVAVLAFLSLSTADGAECLAGSTAPVSDALVEATVQASLQFASGTAPLASSTLTSPWVQQLATEGYRAMFYSKFLTMFAGSAVGAIAAGVMALLSALLVGPLAASPASFEPLPLERFEAPETAAMETIAWLAADAAQPSALPAVIPPHGKTLHRYVVTRLRQPVVAKRVGLTAAQVGRLQRAFSHHEAVYLQAVQARQAGPAGDRGAAEFKEATARNNQELEKTVLDILSPAQVAKLNEVQFQWQGVDTLLDSYFQPGFFGLSDAQSQEIKAIQTWYRAEEQRALAGADRLANVQAVMGLKLKAVERAMQVLSAEQVRAWKSIVGEPFSPRAADLDEDLFAAP